MVDLDPQSIITVGKAVLDILRDIKSLNRIPTEMVSNLQSQILELQSLSISANQQLIEVNGEKDALAAEITRLKDWTAEKDRYELRPLPESLIVYSLKQKYVGNPEPMHSLCPKCYTESTKSIVQVTEQGPTSQIFCPTCGVIGSTRAYLSLPQ